MKKLAKKFNNFWFGLTPEMTKEERELTIFFQLGYSIMPLSLLITWGRYDWQIFSTVIGFIGQISWQLYFAVILTRKRKERLL